MAYLDSTESFDVFIAGAGPSGSSAANVLSSAGLKVLVVEKKMEVGAPIICADMVNLSLDGIQDIGEDKRILIRPVEELRVSGPSNDSQFRMQSSSGQGDAFNAVVERDRLDKEIASRALLSGARLKIRSELTNFEDTGDGVKITYSAGGRIKKVSAGFLILATGHLGDNSKSYNASSSILNRYSFSRTILKEVHEMRLNLDTQGRMDFLVPRYLDEYDVINVNRNDGHSKAEKDSIISGEVSSSISDVFNPGSGNILNVGSTAGLHDPFFLTGFREAYISGQMAAFSILERLENKKKVTEIYSKKVTSEILPRMSSGSKLRKLVVNTSGKKLDDFVKYLSGFDFSEISASEILRVTSLKDSDLEEMLPPNY